MKKLFLLLIINSSLFAQTKIDEYITIEFPGIVKEFDTIIDSKISLKTFQYLNEDESYFFMRTAILENGKETNGLSKNEKELKKACLNFMNGTLKSMNKKGFIYNENMSKIELDSFSAYNMKYYFKNSDSQNAETIILQLNGVYYIAAYSMINVFDEINKNKFFNSLNIDKIKKSKQIIEPYDLKENLLELFFKLIFAIGLFYLWRKYKKTTGNNS